MTQENFQKALVFTLKWEGGLSDHPNDSGGLTNMGITQAFWDANYIRDFPRSVRDLTKDQAEYIYHDRIWKKCGCELVSEPTLQVVMFDTAVNFGVAGGIMFIQEALDINMDGVLGDYTKGRLLHHGNHKELASKIVNNRIAYRYVRVAAKPDQKDFLQGWLNRDRDLAEYITEMGATVIIPPALTGGFVEKMAADLGGSVTMRTEKLADFIKYFVGLPGQSKGIKALLEAIDINDLYRIIPTDMLQESSQWVKDYRSDPSPAPVTAPPVASKNGYICLDVPFFPQTDNYTMADRTCNASACAMAAKFLGAKIQGDNDYLKTLLEKFGDSPDHGAQTRCLEYYGIKSTWETDLGFVDLDRSLARNKPVVIAILHRGAESAPTGGHVIVVIGKTEGGAYIVNDPYGTIGDMYSSDVHNGYKAVYSRQMLSARWTVEGSQSGWGRIFA